MPETSIQSPKRIEEVGVSVMHSDLKKTHHHYHRLSSSNALRYPKRPCKHALDDGPKRHFGVGHGSSDGPTRSYSRVDGVRACHCICLTVLYECKHHTYIIM